MPSYYTIVQYVPDPVIDERINIGVIVVGDGAVRCQFLQNWRRVSQFGAQNIDFLRDFAKEISRACSPQLAFQETPGNWRLNEEVLRQLSADFCNSIQLTSLRGSLLDRDAVLANSVARFLREPQRVRRQLRTRSDVVKHSVRAIERVLVDRIGDSARELVKTHDQVPGKYQSHLYDISVVNGHIWFAAQALSFERQESDDLLKDVRLVAWDIKDVKENTPDLPIGVVLLAPQSSTSTYRDAVKMFQDLDADVIKEDEVKDWAKDKSRRIAA